MLTRTEQIFVNDNRFSDLCHHSKNLWNEANYSIRQEYFASGRIIGYGALVSQLKTSENYQFLNAQSGEGTIKNVKSSWKSYTKAHNDWKKNPEKYLGEPKIPHYKHKDGEAIVIFTNQQCHIRNGYITFPKNLTIEPILTKLPDWTDLREVRIIPKGTGYCCEIVYKTINEEGIINRRWYSRRNNKNRILGIDLGLRNIVAMANNIGIHPIVIKGGVLKSINQFYNKIKSLLQSIYDKQRIKHGFKMEILTQYRNGKIKDVMHKISRCIIDYCIKHNIGTIVIGHNPEWKQEINIGKKNNQNFVQIPFNTLIKMIQYKSEEAGIYVIIQEESHTSKCSFLDEESIEHHETYMGKRFCRGLFKSALGKIINADVQGAYNIIRKAIPDAFAKGIEGVGLHPIRVNPLGGNIL